MHWLLHILGIDTQQSYWYDAWSGCIPALLTGTGLTAGVWAFVRHRNCHVDGCWRLGRHHVDGTPWVVCRRHSPGGAPTHQDVLDAHREHLERTAK